MEKEIETFFTGEKKQSLVFLVLGSLAIVTGGIGFFYFDEPIWSGAAIPFIVVGIMQFLKGIFTYFKVDKQKAFLLNQFKNDPKKFAKEELERMIKVNANFEKNRNVEMMLLFLGLTFTFMGVFALKQMGNSVDAFALGTGLSLALLMGILLSLNLFASWRIASYIHKLKKMKKELGVS